MNHEQLCDAWALLENETPLFSDCGQLCARACCVPDEDGQGGVLLFPGEDTLIGRIPWGRVVELDDRGDGEPGKLLLCDKPCDRTKRPLGCRLFPLTPAWNGREWGVGLDRRAWPVCPLMGSGIKGLSKEFVVATRSAVLKIAASEEGRAFLMAWAKIEALFGEW